MVSFWTNDGETWNPVAGRLHLPGQGGVAGSILVCGRDFTFISCHKTELIVNCQSAIDN